VTLDWHEHPEASAEYLDAVVKYADIEDGVSVTSSLTQPTPLPMRSCNGQNRHRLTWVAAETR